MKSNVCLSLRVLSCLVLFLLLLSKSCHGGANDADQNRRLSLKLSRMARYIEAMRYLYGDLQSELESVEPTNLRWMVPWSESVDEVDGELSLADGRDAFNEMMPIVYACASTVGLIIVMAYFRSLSMSRG